MTDSVLSNLIMPFFGVILVIFLAYWGTKWLSKKYRRICSGKYMKIMERVALGQDKSLVLVEMSDKIYFLAVSAKGVETISVLAHDQVKELPVIERNQAEFSQILADMIKKQPPLGGLFKGLHQDKTDLAKKRNFFGGFLKGYLRDKNDKHDRNKL
ncbi:MAG: flagellar biosynthetic protein FliO [Bacillota bacterium]|jgi:flagellar protein FliO/FliZ